MTAVSCCSVGSGAGTRSSGRRASLLARLASFRSPFAFLLPAPAPARHQGKTTRIRPPAVTGRAWCERGVRGAHDAGVSGRPRCVSALWRINRPTPSRTEENRAASVRSESERKKGFRSAASCWLGRCWRLLGPNRQRMRAHSAAPERSAAEILNDAVITARCRQTLKPCVNAETERQLSCLEGRGGGVLLRWGGLQGLHALPRSGGPPTCGGEGVHGEAAVLLVLARVLSAHLLGLRPRAPCRRRCRLHRAPPVATSATPQAAMRSSRQRGSTRRRDEFMQPQGFL